MRPAAVLDERACMHSRLVPTRQPRPWSIPETPLLCAAVRLDISSQEQVPGKAGQRPSKHEGAARWCFCAARLRTCHAAGSAREGLSRAEGAPASAGALAPMLRMPQCADRQTSVLRRPATTALTRCRTCRPTSGRACRPRASRRCWWCVATWSGMPGRSMHTRSGPCADSAAPVVGAWRVCFHVAQARPAERARRAGD